MADNSNVLREYLISLGYKVNQQAQNKFIDGLNRVSVVAATAGKAALTAAVALGTMANVYAHSMEKMYYASRFSGASGANLSALSAGFKAIGLSGEGAVEAIKRFALLLQTPGIKEQLNGYGIATTGKDTAEIWKNAVRTFSKIADSDWTLGSGLARDLLGLSPEDFQTIRKNLDTLFAAASKNKKNLVDVGVNQDALNKQAAEYEKLWRGVWDKVDAIGKRFTAEMLPAMREFVTWVDKMLTPIMNWLGQQKTSNPEAVSMKPGTPRTTSQNINDTTEALKVLSGQQTVGPGQKAITLSNVRSGLWDYFTTNTKMGRDWGKSWDELYSPKGPVSMPSAGGAAASQATPTLVQNNTTNITGVATVKDIEDIVKQQNQEILLDGLRVLSPKLR